MKCNNVEIIPLNKMKNLIIILMAIFPFFSCYSIDLTTRKINPGENNYYPIINLKYIEKPSEIFINNIKKDYNFTGENDYLYIYIQNNSLSITLKWNKGENNENDEININTTILSETNNILTDTDLINSTELTIIDEDIDINGNEMFQNCTILSTINFINFRTDLIVNASHMFDSCTSLEYIYNFNLQKVEDLSYIFYNCTKLNIQISSWNFNTVKKMEFMFYNCRSFLEISIMFNTHNVTNMNSLFYNCINLRNLTIKNNFDTSLVTNMEI